MRYSPCLQLYLSAKIFELKGHTHMLASGRIEDHLFQVLILLKVYSKSLAQQFFCSSYYPEVQYYLRSFSDLNFQTPTCSLVRIETIADCFSGSLEF